MEEDIVKEIMKECNIKDKIIAKVLIKICKYYKIKNIIEIVKDYKK